MNFNTDSISNYLVLTIFILAILTVLAPSLKQKFTEFITGKKQVDDFDLDDLVRKKKSQLSRTSLPTMNEKPLLIRLKESENINKEKIEKIINSVQWGVAESEFCPKTHSLFESNYDFQGMSLVLAPIFNKQHDFSEDQILTNWIQIYDSSLLWLNLYNGCKKEQVIKEIEPCDSSRALLAFRFELEDLKTKEQSEISQMLENFAQDSNYLEFNIFSRKAQDLFTEWHKNALIFKSLRSK